MTFNDPAATPAGVSPHRSLRQRVLRAGLCGPAAVGCWAAEASAAAPLLPPAGPQAAMLATGALMLFALLLATWSAVRQSRLRRSLQAQLVETLAHVDGIESMLDVWLWQTDREHRLVSMLAPAGSAAVGWPPVGRPEPIWEQWQSDNGADLRATVERKAAFDDWPVHAPPSAVSPALSQRHALLRGRARTDAHGRFAGYIGTLRDAPAGPAAAAPGSMPTLADHESFVYTVSHDLRAPIRVVEGFTKIVKEDFGDRLDAMGNAHLDRVLAAAVRMNEMIDALLALSKLASQPLSWQRVDLSALATDVVGDLRRESPGREVQVQIEPGMAAVGDPALLRIVVENLIGNAWKYTGKTAAANIHFGRHPGATDTFSVHDNGAGFDMRYAGRLYGVFQRLHSASDFPGTGVGLASVQRIVHRHGGRMCCQAAVNRGASFSFSLPQGTEPR